MRLSKANYYADIVLYPAVVAALSIYEMSNSTAMARYHWIAACLLGVAAWTLIEYLIHRFVFHVVPPAMQMHLDHHSDPRATIGTPIWVSIGAFTSFGFAPLWWYFGYEIATGGLAGLLIGYSWYVMVHHAVHHWQIDQTSWLYVAKVRHAMHYYRTDERNFGVTTGFWDWIFGTTLEARPVNRQQRS